MASGSGQWAACAVAGALAAAVASAAEPDAGQLAFFETKIRPLLAEHCHECHSHRAKKLKAGLFLDHRAGLLQGGDRGPAVEPGHPDRSRLIEAVSYSNIDLQMPPRSRLPDQAVEDLKKWIAWGSPWPQEAETVGQAAAGSAFNLEQRRASHWSWRPLAAPAVPAVRAQSWPRDPLDRFILEKLEAAKVSPAPDADARALIRRLSFAIRGLPPEPEEAGAFAADPSQAAWEQQVDRYLADPAFGEHWARHWLDLVRYAETNGHEFDSSKADAWRYRDYVVRALNADVPYRQFVREHMAGDLLPEPRRIPETGANESILGTGFWFLGEWVHSPVDIRQDEADRFENMIDVMSKTFLGLTVACARCHDHKFDAIRAEDFYALQGYLQSSHQRLVHYETIDANRITARDLEAWDAAEGPKVVQAWKQAAQGELRRAGRYLQVILRGKSPEEAEALARQEGLNTEILKAWAGELDRSLNDAGHLLHPLAQFKAGKKPAQIKPPQPSPPLSADEQQDVVADFRRMVPADLIQDGFSFRLMPSGAAVFDASADHGLAGTAVFSAARRHRDWLEIQSVDSARDVGNLKKHDRSGKTLFTQTFALRHPQIHYLVQGKGTAFACVDSHRMLQGPLHGETFREFEIKGDRPQWVSQNLARYVGHRLHVELAPESDDFQVLAVVQGDRARVIAEDMLPLPLWHGAMAEERAASEEGLIESLSALLMHAVENFAAGRPGDPAQAEAADWLIRHPELTLAAETRKTLAAQTADFSTRRQTLAGSIQAKSRTAMAMIDGSAENEYIFLRGSWKNPGPEAPRHFLEALGGREIPASDRGSGRLELADQMVDYRRNPFIARVMVNRIWHHLFGRGLVPTTDDFGLLGLAPTHPELLDHLAITFVTTDAWSIKAHIRRLVLSRAWMQSSAAARKAAEEQDAGNRLWHRAMRRRLSGEEIRDAMLQISGRLDRRQGGESIPVHLTDFMGGRGRPDNGPVDGAGRRSLYLAVRRNFLSPMLMVFDTPIPFSSMGRRSVSNVPAQALTLMNDPFVTAQAQEWAKRLLSEPGDARQRVQKMYEQALSRPPTGGELEEVMAFFGGEAGQADPVRWAELAHVIFNLKEFIFLR